MFDDGRLPGNCGVMKIDTDGYDLFVLMGAKRFLMQARPIIFGEFAAHCLKWHGQSIHDVQVFLATQDYELYTRREGWSFAPLRDGEHFVMDALCVPREKRDRVLWCLPQGYDTNTLTL